MIQIVAALAAVALSDARADTWTNQAGHALRATLGAYTNGIVTLVQDGGRSLELPLSALCEDDQRRIRTRYGESSLPEYVVQAHRAASALVARHDLLADGGGQADDRARLCESALALFDARVRLDSLTNVHSAARADLVRLRDSLKSPPRP